MAINWGLLNPNIAAEGITSGMNAFQAVLQRGQQEREQAQIGQLRQLQIQSASSALEDKAKEDKISALMAQAYNAHSRGDLDTARAATSQAISIDAGVASRIGQALTKQDQERQAALAASNKAKQEEAERAAPTMLAGIPKLEAWAKANPDATRSDYEAQAQSLFGDFYHPDQLDAMMNPQARQAALERFTVIRDNSPAYRAQKRDELAAQREARAAARENRLAAAAERANTLAEARLRQGNRSWQTINGRRVLVDDTTGETIRDAGDAGTGVAGGSGQGAIGERWFDRLVGAAGNATASLDNILSLDGIGANSGVFGIGASPGKSLMTSTVDTLRNKLSPDAVRSYNQQMATLARSISQVEAGGGATNEAMVNEVRQALTIREGDLDGNGFLPLAKLAEVPQLVHRYLDPKLASPRVSEPQKALIRRLYAEIDDLVPFTPKDVFNFKNGKGLEVRRGETLEQWIARVKGTRKPTDRFSLDTNTGLGTGAQPTLTPTPANQGGKPPLDAFFH